MYKEFVIHIVTFLKDDIPNKLWIYCNSGLVRNKSTSLLFRLSTITNLLGLKKDTRQQIYNLTEKVQESKS